MQPLQEGFETRFYCDLNCMYARKIFLKKYENEERLQIFLNRYTNTSRNREEDYSNVTKEAILKRLNITQETREQIKENNEVREEYHNSWKEAIAVQEELLP